MDHAPIFSPRATAIPVLRYLVAVADERHFGRAAALAKVSQPTLSSIIAQWERKMRCRVFERDPRGVRITPAGEHVIAAARRALEALRAVEQAATEAKPPFFGPVRLGVIPTVGPYALPFVTAALERAFPDLEAPIREAPTAELTAALDAGRIDIALVAILPGMAERYVAEPIYEEPFFVALPRGHRLASKATIDPSDLESDQLLLLDEGHCLREQALDLCHRRPNAASGADYRATSLETLRQIVASGAGVTLLPALAIVADDRRLVIRKVKGNASRTIGLIWRRGDSRGEAYRQWLAPIRRAVPHEVVRTVS